MPKSVLTYQFRIKDSVTAKHLNRMSSSVNYIWNSVNDLTNKTWIEEGKFLAAYDISPTLKGRTKELGIHSQTIQAIVEEHHVRRKKAKRSKLKWRSKKHGTLGWIPFKKAGIKVIEDSVSYCKKTFRFWKSREIEGDIKSGSFSQDARGRWYVNISCEVENHEKTEGIEPVGIDLGLKYLAALSTGEVITNPKSYAMLEKKLGKAQRANKKKFAKQIHAKISNIRKDYLHKESTKLVKRFKQIFVGDVSSLKLAKTRLAKSVLDSGWGMFKTMLKNKAIRLGVDFQVTDEKYSTVTCSVCGSRTGPSGLSSLVVRNWECLECGSLHQRDLNAALNILNFALGHQSPLGESPSFR